MGQRESNEAATAADDNKGKECVFTAEGLRDVPEIGEKRVRSLVLDLNELGPRIASPQRLAAICSGGCLQELSLVRCMLDEVPLEAIAAASGTLRVLNLAGNNLVEVGAAAALLRLTRLEELRLDGNKLRTLPDLSALSSLVLLSVEGNRDLGDALLACVPPNVSVLRCSQCGLTPSADLASLVSRCGRLRELCLADNSLRTLPPSIATALPQLRKLDLARNRLCGELPQLPASVSWLDLSFNAELSPAVLHVTEHLPGLQMFRVSGCGFLSDDGLRQSISTAPQSLQQPRQSCMVIADYAVPDEVLPGVYLGEAECAWNAHCLQRLGVTHILTVAFIAPAFPELFEYHIAEVDDRNCENLLGRFGECIAFIEKALAGGGKVLVHCRHGVSRSATVVAAFVMVRLRLGWAAAIEHVRSRRRRVSPNDGFLAQLEQWEAICKTTKDSSQQ